jgi:hypothetical protein
MTDKLFFGEIERQGAKAREAYMKARGPHNGKDLGEKEIEVAGNPGTMLGKNEDSGGS